MLSILFHISGIGQLYELTCDYKMRMLCCTKIKKYYWTKHLYSLCKTSMILLWRNAFKELSCIILILKIKQHQCHLDIKIICIYLNIARQSRTNLNYNNKGHLIKVLVRQCLIPISKRYRFWQAQIWSNWANSCSELS